MNKKILIIVLCISFLISKIFIYAEGNESMNWQIYEKEINGIPLKFTIFHMDNKNSDNIVYYFHGAGGNHLTWLDNGKRIRDSWILKSINPPIVVGVSLGETWNLIPEHLDNSGNLHIIKSEVFDFIETKYGPFKNRSGIGVSMGGFNLLQVILDLPDFFDKILLISPAIADLAPYSSQEEIVNYVQKSSSLNIKQKIKSFLTGTTPTENIELILSFWKNLVRNNKEWEAIDPFLQIPRMTQIPDEIVITCGKNDVYGFYDGSEKLFNLVKDRTRSHLYPIKNEQHLIFPPEEVLIYTDLY